MAHSWRIAFTSRRRTVLVILFSLLAAASVAAAAGQVFDNGTVAKKYNFRVSGQGSEASNVISVIGWFEANASGVNGNVFQGRAEVAITANNSMSSESMPLSETIPCKLLVKDAANGVYDVFLRFDSAPSSIALTMTVIFDDQQGRAAKIQGRYSASLGILGGGGVLTGEMTAR